MLAARTAEQALALAAGNDFHLLLTDSVLPHGSGASLTDQIGRIRAGRPVLFMSGHSEGALTSQQIPGQGTPVLRKPFNASQLLESVQTALQAGQGPQASLR